MSFLTQDNQKAILAFVGGLSIGLAAYLATKTDSTTKAVSIKKGNKKPVEKLLGLEIGGTGCKIAVIVRRWNSITNKYDYQVVTRGTVETTTPEETVAALLNIVKEHSASQIGIASFGPVCLQAGDPAYGNITTTPKPKWKHFPLLQVVKLKSGNNNVFIDTDVNAAALAEWQLGNHKANSVCYITVGTGVGVGIVTDGRAVHGLTHPEGGHILVRLDPYDENFEGSCPYHKTCVEGLVTNGSIAKRLGISVHDLPNIEKDHPVWKACGYYLAQLCLNLTLLVSPEVIILGGGIMNQPTLLPTVHARFIELLANYVEHPRLGKDVETYIKLPALGADAGVLGGAVLCPHVDE